MYNQEEKSSEFYIHKLQGLNSNLGNFKQFLDQSKIKRVTHHKITTVYENENKLFICLKKDDEAAKIMILDVTNNQE